MVGLVDEDDDCQRIERGNFADPFISFKFGAKNGGIDNNPQADVSGDRGNGMQIFLAKKPLHFSIGWEKFVFAAQNWVIGALTIFTYCIFKVGKDGVAQIYNRKISRQWNIKKGGNNRV